jgi:hypothetical protein
MATCTKICAKICANLPVDFSPEMWYSLSVGRRESYPADPEKKFEKTSKKGLTKATKCGKITSSRGADKPHKQRK